MNKYKVRSDGRTAYERITAHKCRQQVIGFAEYVDFILETDKTNMHKGDSRVKKGIFLGYIWRSTEYIIGTADGIYKCRTVRRRPEETSYDPECIDDLKIHYDDYVLKGAQSNPIAHFRGLHGPDGEEPVPLRSRESVPRRLYIPGRPITKTWGHCRMQRM